jgi:hypothetical protein
MQIQPKILLYISFVILLCGCENKEIEVNDLNVTVYACANIETESKANSTCATYVDGIPTILNNDTSVYTFSTSMYISGKDIYVSGFTWDNNGQVASYWKNGEVVKLSGIWAKCIAVIDSKVYVVGYDDTSTARYGTLWTNGQETHLTKEWQSGIVNSVCISDSNVFMAGSESTNEGPSRLLYWKNNTENCISNGTYSGEQFNAICVENNNIYLTGDMHDNNNVNYNYWKNGQPYTVKNGSPSWYPNSLYVTNGNVYIAGSYAYADKKSIAKYWKNGEEINLTDKSVTAKANSIFVYGKDVYVGGTINNYPCYWVNGKLVKLKCNKGGEVVSIVVKAK